MSAFRRLFADPCRRRRLGQRRGGQQQQQQPQQQPPAWAMATRACATGPPGGGTLETLRFDNSALRRLPLDPSDDPAPRQVPGAVFSRVRPSPVERPRVVAVSVPAMRLLGLRDPEAEAARPEAAEFLSGNRVLPGAQPAAHCYCGHQFGSFAGQLGDGAAMYLGEVQAGPGQRWEMQLKGAGPTPYSRHADGRKVLRSSLREFLCSEAMHHLGVPTTRAGSCVTSHTTVLRDVHYDGNARPEQCSVVLRIAPSFLRFGSFEIFKPTDKDTGRTGPSAGREDIKVTMLDYVIDTFYPELLEGHGDGASHKYAAFFREVVQRTAQLVAEWQCVGFCHGVLNTDNMSILGLTIDYGPFGFMDRFDPHYVCNGSDEGGRYAYDQQPDMCRWNLEKLAEALAPTLPAELSRPALDEYGALYEAAYLRKMRRKLGLGLLEQPDDAGLVTSLLETMQSTGADFTNSFRLLSRLTLEAGSVEELATLLCRQCATVEEMKRASKPRIDPRQLSLLLALAQANPQVLRMFGGRSGLERELRCVEASERWRLATPAEKEAEDARAWTQWLNAYSCRLLQEREVSGLEAASWRRETAAAMDSANPRVVLRNYIAQRAIAAAEEGNFTEVQSVLRVLETPYADATDEEESKAPRDTEQALSAAPPASYTSKPPPWALDLCVT
ncbi:unnamed protein product [Lampetra fluviatilis]